jgi:hypothetical protein
MRGFPVCDCIFPLDRDPSIAIELETMIWIDNAEDEVLLIR